MGCKMIAAITWTQLELRSLLEDEESHVYFERVKRHLGLHPFHLTDLNAALREILTSTVNSYDPKLQGIILSYRNPKLLTRMGTVLYDTCYIHVDVEADFYIFRPNVGDTLKGIVNKKSQDHVGILVHKTFNATIPRPDADENWPGHSIHIGQEIRFNVTCLDFKGRLPYIRGSLDEEDYLRGCQIFDESLAGTEIVDVKPKKTTFSYDDDDEELVNESNADQETIVDNDVEEKVSRKKSKKLKLENNDDGIRSKTKKKHKVEVTISENEIDPCEENQSLAVLDDSNFEEEYLPGKLKLKKEKSDDQIQTKKKKRKSKVKAEEILSEVESDVHETIRRDVQENGIDEDEFLSPKSKKLKRETMEEKIDSKNQTKPKLEVERTHLYETNGNRNSKDESNDEKSRKKPKVKKEILSSETESDANRSSKNKRMKMESNDERSSNKKRKFKAEVSSSETESVLNESKQSVKTKLDGTGEKIKKKHRIKAEVSILESYD